MKRLLFPLLWIFCAMTIPAFAAGDSATSETEAWTKAEEALKAYLKPIDPGLRFAEYRSALLRKYLPGLRLYVRVGPNDSRSSIFFVDQLGTVLDLGQGSWTGHDPKEAFRLPKITEFIRSRKIKVQNADEAIEVVRLIEEIQGAPFYIDFLRLNTADFKVFEKSVMDSAHGSPKDWKYGASPKKDGWRVEVEYVGPPASIMQPPVYEITADEGSFFSNILKLRESSFP